MSLWKIAWRNMQQRALATTLTAISMALGVALVVLVLVIHGHVNTYFNQGAEGYHLIIGAKGGKLQLVLNTVYHLSQPIENIPYSYYKEFVDGQFSMYTKAAIPFCLGDSYRAGGETFRVVATTPDMFEKLAYTRDKNGDVHYQFQPGGRNFRHENFFEAVLGSVAANRTGLKVGSTFRPSHGIVEGDEGHKHDAFTVVGILAPTGTPNDRAMFINMEGFYLLEGHAMPARPPAGPADLAHESHSSATPGHSRAAGQTTSDETMAANQADPEAAARTNDDAAPNVDAKPADVEHVRSDEADHDHHTPLPENQREVTAILVLASDAFPGGEQLIYKAVNKGNVAQAVFPVQEIQSLLTGVVGPIQLILLVLTVMIVVVSGVGILVSIYNSMSDRRRDIAVMRALGARRTMVMSVVLFESILISLIGGLAGVVLGHVAIGLASPIVVARTGVRLSMLRFEPQELILIPGLVILATLAGFVPAVTAYRTDVGRSLSAAP